MNNPFKPEITDFDDEMMNAVKLMRIDLPNMINRIVKSYLSTENHMNLLDRFEKEIKKIVITEIDSAITANKILYQGKDKTDDR